MATQAVIQRCKTKLLETKMDLLNRYRNLYETSRNQERQSGDEADLTHAQLEENRFLIAQGRIRTQLLEVESALARIHHGVFGICEETGEEIEEARLLAIPSTRLSIEGAEIRETLGQKSRVRTL